MKIPFNDLSCTLCVLQNGNLEWLKYAHENESKLTTNTVQIASENITMNVSNIWLKMIVHAMKMSQLWL